MSTQKHLIQFAASILFVVLMGGSVPEAEAKNKQHKSHNTILEHKKHSNTSIKHKHIQQVAVIKGQKQIGIASYYGYESGKKTAMGTKFNPLGLTAAHRTLPLPSLIKVTNMKNNMSIVVTVNDRGPYAKGRILDLSLGAARAIALKGIGKVTIEVL